jgi:hypothetical protein
LEECRIEISSTHSAIDVENLLKSDADLLQYMTDSIKKDCLIENLRKLLGVDTKS